MQALQARWEDSLRARAAIRPHSPVPQLDELLAPHRRHRVDPEPASTTVRHLITRTAPGEAGRSWSPKFLPNSLTAPPRRTGGACLGVCDLGLYLVGDTGIEPVTSSV
jgi:hypothetical protein